MIESEARPIVWASLLSTACEMLAQVTAATVSKVSVTQTLAGSPEEARDIERLSAHLVDQYGLAASVEVAQRSITVTLSRRVAETDGVDPTSGARRVGVRWDGHDRKRR